MPVREACPTDIPALHALIESAYRGDSARRGWTHEADLLGGQRTDAEALADLIAETDGAVLLLEDGADLVGCVHVKREDAGSAYLGLLSVDPARQAQGAGRALLAAAEAHAAHELGAASMRMTVIAQRPDLIAYYVRRGYADTGRTAPFPLDDVRFGLPRRRDLYFVVLEKTLG